MADLHPSFEPDVERLLKWMMTLYPWVRFEGIQLFEVDCKNHSLAYAARDQAKIFLNAYWFAKPSWMLRAAALGNRMKTTVSPDVASWHAGMTEPEHTIIHEFGHLVAGSAGVRADRLAEELYREVLDDPSKAATGYALANRDELFADTFAVAHVGSPRARMNAQAV